MAITREQVLTAVEKYLPRTVNYVRSGDFGDRDPTPVFERIQQILLTTLLVDPDSAYYIIFLASQRLLSSVEDVIAQLELLQSIEQLKSITGADPSRIEDLSKLTAARVSLVRLSTSVLQEESFGTSNLSDFQQDVEGFLVSQVMPNVDGGNKNRTSADIRATMATLQASWAAVLEQRAIVFSLLEKYVDEDLRTRVSTLIISAIQDTLTSLERALPALTTEAQAELAETILVDLAAAEAAITIVGNAPSPVGELVAGPANDGRTSRSYLALEGTGRTQPVRPVITGEDGALYLEGPLGGAPFTSLTGTPAAPGPTTSTVVDSSVPDFLAEGIQPGMYITFVDLGTTHEITMVTTTELTISPKTPVAVGLSLRYAVTNHAPGRYFRSGGTDFWDEGSVAAQSTELASGASGEWVRTIKASGADGTNVYATGSDGVLRPRKLEGAASTQFVGSSVFATGLADPGFLSNSVAPLDELYVVNAPNNSGNPYIVSSVAGENELNITGVWGLGGVGPWYIEDPAVAPTAFEAATATFLTSGGGAGDWVLLSGPTTATYSVDSVVGQTELQLDSGALTYTTGVTWEAVTSGEDRLYSASVNFRTVGIEVGDLVDIAGHGTFAVLNVTSDYLQLDAPFADSPTVAVSGLSFEVYADPSADSLTFRQGDGVDLDILDIDGLVAVQEYVSGTQRVVNQTAYLDVDGCTYQVESRVDEDTLRVFPLSSGVGKVQIPGQVIRDENATFVSDGVDPSKHVLVMVGGPSAGRTFTLLGVLSETELQFTPPASASASGDPSDVYAVRPIASLSGLPWRVHRGSSNRKVVYPGFFQPDDVGSIFVWRRGDAEEVRVAVDSYVSDDEVWLARGIGTASLGAQPVAIMRTVKPGMQLYANSRRYSIRDIYDRNVLDLDPKMSNAPGVDVDFVVMTAGTNLFSSRILDPVGAAELNATSGFTNDFANARVNLMVDSPVRARYLQAYDPDKDGFSEAFQVNTNLRLGYRRVTYQLLVDVENKSNQFLASEVAPLPEEADFLTVWGLRPVFSVAGVNSATPDMELTVEPATRSGLRGQQYAVHRGGSEYYGRWVLYNDQNDRLSVADDTSSLRLNVAEVLIEFGELNVVSVASGSSGTVADDGDADGTSGILTDAAAAFVATGASFGDRLTVTYPDSSVETAWVTRVFSDTRVGVAPELPEGASLAWELERNSVSASLKEAERLKKQMEALRDLVSGYFVARNDTVDAIIELLQDQRLDRAVELLLSGRIDEFINMTPSGSSYATLARTSLQGVGASTAPTEAALDRVAGVNPATAADGTPASRKSISSTTALSPSSGEDLGEDVDVRVALAKALSEIAGDEVLRSLAFNTFEEQRNRAIFELLGEVESGFISDEDPTLPWIAQTGSLRARINARYRKALAAVQYMIDHPEDFEDIG